MTAQTLTIRQLEDLLRRVFRSLDHGISPDAVTRSVKEAAAYRAVRRRGRLALLLALVAAALVVGGFVVGWSGRGLL